MAVVFDPMLAGLDQGWAALIGALVGGLAALGATLLTGWAANRQAAEQQRGLNRAAAILLQDDFWHFQATLARALDTSCWWSMGQFLPPQATIDDRKTVWAACTAVDTNMVAGAQGWMDVLMQQRKAIGQGTAPLTEVDEDTMVLTFCRLEECRRALAKLAKREFTDFRASRVLLLLSPEGRARLVDLVARGCKEVLQVDKQRSPEVVAQAEETPSLIDEGNVAHSPPAKRTD
jgi:hypothetical protein